MPPESGGGAASEKIRLFGKAEPFRTSAAERESSQTEVCATKERMNEMPKQEIGAEFTVTEIIQAHSAIM